jgi:inosine-uridine nucleoside N-ribohydrolase
MMNVPDSNDSRVSLILDTDIGGDIDDTWALAMLLGCPRVDLKLIVTGFDNTPEKTRLAAKILDQAGRTDVPIGTGIKTSALRLNQSDWVQGYDLAAYPGVIHEDGVQAMIDMLKAAPEPMTLMCIGPMTNIAEALRREPNLASHVRRLVVMAGSIYQGYAGKPRPEPECNVICDVPAFRAVLAEPWEITMTPTDGCGTLILRDERFAAVSGSQAPLARIVTENYDAWAMRADYPRDSSSVLFDTAAAYLVFDESFCEMKTLHISVHDDGMTVPDDNGRAVRCHLDWKSRDAFEQLLVQALTRDNPARAL